MEHLLTPELSIFFVLALGFVLGLQHATEGDHLAAVTAIVSEKKQLFSASLVGGLWGVGHTTSLFVMGALVIFLKLQIDERTESRLEAIVGGMLILLGFNALWKLYRGGRIHAHTHSHGEHAHVHFHTHQTAEKELNSNHHNLRFNIRSVIVGMVHGLAGTAGLMLLVLPKIDSPLIALSFILIFGIGSIGGMMVMSFLVGLPLYFTAHRFTQLHFAIRCLAGVFSLVFGMSIIYERLVTILSPK
jgi:high-affinity nickel permease